MKWNEWKQWYGFKKLHAVRKYNHYIAACGIAYNSYDVFVEPPTTTIKCKNCERSEAVKGTFGF